MSDLDFFRKTEFDTEVFDCNYANGNVESYRILNNDMEVVFCKQTPETSEVTMMVTYRVGSRNEFPGITGKYHYGEHIRFKGSEKYQGKTGIWFAQGRQGVRMNAETTTHMTRYYGTSHSSYLTEMLRIEYDRAIAPIFTQEDVDDEMKAVRNEMEGGLDNATRQAYQSLNSLLYPVHPRGRPTIGNRADVMNTTADELRDHVIASYRPDVTQIVISGYIPSPETVLEQIAETFATIPRDDPNAKYPRLPKIVTKEEPQLGVIRKSLHMTTTKYVLMVGHRVPQAVNTNMAALTLLARLLNGGNVQERSPLYTQFIKTKKLTSISAGVDFDRDGGVFYLYASVPVQQVLQTGDRIAVMADEYPEACGLYLDQLGEDAARRYLARIVGPEVMEHMETVRGSGCKQIVAYMYVIELMLNKIFDSLADPEKFDALFGDDTCNLLDDVRLNDNTAERDKWQTSLAAAQALSDAYALGDTEFAFARNSLIQAMCIDDIKRVAADFFVRTNRAIVHVVPDSIDDVIVTEDMINTSERDLSVSADIDGGDAALVQASAKLEREARERMEEWNRNKLKLRETLPVMLIAPQLRLDDARRVTEPKVMPFTFDVPGEPAQPEPSAERKFYVAYNYYTIGQPVAGSACASGKGPRTFTTEYTRRMVQENNNHSTTLLLEMPVRGTSFRATCADTPRQILRNEMVVYLTNSMIASAAPADKPLGSLQAELDRNSTYVSYHIDDIETTLAVLFKDQASIEASFPYIRDILFNLDFDKNEFDRIKSTLALSLATMEDNVLVKARHAARKVIFAPDNMKALRASPEIKREVLDTIMLQDVVDTYHRLKTHVNAKVGIGYDYRHLDRGQEVAVYTDSLLDEWRQSDYHMIQTYGKSESFTAHRVAALDMPLDYSSSLLVTGDFDASGRHHLPNKRLVLNALNDFKENGVVVFMRKAGVNAVADFSTRVATTLAADLFDHFYGRGMQKIRVSDGLTYTASSRVTVPMPNDGFDGTMLTMAYCPPQSVAKVVRSMHLAWAWLARYGPEARDQPPADATNLWWMENARDQDLDSTCALLHRIEVGDLDRLLVLQDGAVRPSVRVEILYSSPAVIHATLAIAGVSSGNRMQTRDFIRNKLGAIEPTLPGLGDAIQEMMLDARSELGQAKFRMAKDSLSGVDRDVTSGLSMVMRHDRAAEYHRQRTGTAYPFPVAEYSDLNFMEAITEQQVREAAARLFDLQNRYTGADRLENNYVVSVVSSKPSAVPDRGDMLVSDEQWEKEIRDAVTQPVTEADVDALLEKYVAKRKYDFTKTDTPAMTLE